MPMSFQASSDNARNTITSSPEAKKIDVRWIASCESAVMETDEGIDTLWLCDPEDGSRWIARRAFHANINAYARLQREVCAGRKLAQIAECQVPRAIWDSDFLYLVFKAAPSMCALKDSPETAAVPTFLRLAIACTQELARWHEAGLAHGDLRHEHIFVDESNVLFIASGRLKDDDMRIQSAKSLPYRAPELDQGEKPGPYADLYALGTIFFRLLAGSAPLPGEAIDDWQYAHSAIEPTALSALRPDVPAQLGRLIAKLLSKNAKSRYSSARSLLADLARCQSEYAASQNITGFDLDAVGALTDKFISQRVHGRENELEQLQNALNRVQATGTTEVVMLAGRAGVGKSVLAKWLLKRAQLSGGSIGEGKCDQLGAEIPYAVIVQSVRMLLLGILGQEQEQVEKLSQRWLERLSGHSNSVTELVPEARHILGASEPAFSPLTPQGQARTERALVRSFEAFAERGRPTVIFLDDLQWADDATHSFLEEFIANPPGDVLLIGAYRDNDNTFFQRYLQAKHATRSAAANFLELTVEPLTITAFKEIVADALKRSGAKLGGLVEILHAKSGGNPYFAQQLLHSWVDGGVLELVSGGDEWRWVEEKMALTGYADHVVDLLIQRIVRLPATSRKVLQSLGCIGVRSEVELLARVSDLDCNEFAIAIEQLATTGLLVRLGSSCVFQHDRVLEAAYALTPPGERSAAHARVARSMITYWRDCLDDVAYEIGNQIEKVALEDIIEEEKPTFAHLLLAAARRAQRASAVGRAVEYVRTAQSLMTAHSWDIGYAPAYEAALIECECLVALGELALAAECIEAILPRAISPLARASVHKVEAVLHTLQSDYRQAIEVALAGLGMLGVPLRRDPSAAEVQEAYDSVLRALDGRQISELVDLPICEDEEIRIVMGLLSTLVASFFFVEDISFTHVAKLVELTVKHGVAPDSPYGLSWFGVCISSRYGLAEDGYAFGLAALNIVEKHGFESGRIATLVALDQVAVWTQPLEVALEYAQQARRRGISSGDIGMACYACNHIVSDMLAMGEVLPLIDEAAEQGIALTRSIGYLDIELLIRSQQEFVELLTKGHRNGDEDAWIANCRWRARQAESLATKFFVWVYAGMSAVYQQQWAHAVSFLRRALVFIKAIPAHISISDCYLFYALALSRSEGKSKEVVVQVLKSECERFEVWARGNRNTFQNKLQLLQGELARCEGNHLKALMCFEQAARTANASGFPHEQALAHEFAATICRDQSLEIAAAQHSRLAKAAYVRWGAVYKATSIRVTDSLAQESSSSEEFEQNDSRARSAMQLGMRAAQALSSESVKEKLVETMMSDMLIHAGAQYGALIRFSDGTPTVVASARSTEKSIVTSIDVVEPNQRVVPMTLLNMVIRTKESVVINDAESDAVSMRVQRENVAALRSVLCLPLLRAGELLGVLYLENNLASGIFNPARVLRLELMAPQIAIALESARLYEQLILESDARAAAERNLHAARAKMVENAHLTVLANFAASIAHEINQPLGAIVTSSEAAFRWLNRAEPDIARAQAGLQRVKKAGLRAAEIIRALRGLARQAPTEMETIDMPELISEVVALLSDDLVSNEVQISLALEPDVAVEGDKVQLQQVVLNLLKNAVEAMSEGSSCMQRELSVVTRVVDQQLQICIGDRGPGIADDDVERIFEPFYSTKDNGLGMGLAICRTIAEAHGGGLTAENREGGGASFLMVIPCGTRKIGDFVCR